MAIIRYYLRHTREERTPKFANMPIKDYSTTVSEAIASMQTFQLVCNLEDNQFYLVHGRKRKSDRHIKTFNFRTERDRCLIQKAIQQYNSKTSICKTRLIAEYGKTGMMDVAFSRCLDNPYYKCAAKMVVYNQEVIEYQLNKQVNRCEKKC